MEAYLESLKAKIEAEIYYSPTYKAFFIGLVDEIPKNDPEKFLATLVDRINIAGTDRSRELAKFVGRCLYQFRAEKGDKDTAASLVLLNSIILQRR